MVDKHKNHYMEKKRKLYRNNIELKKKVATNLDKNFFQGVVDDRKEFDSEAED